MSDEKPRGHILTVTEADDYDPKYPSFNHSVECLNVDKCGGWIECDQPHEVDGRSAEDGPDDSDDGAPWKGYSDFVFHGVSHEWQDGYGWTVPYQGCVVAAADHYDAAADIALDHGCGRHEVEDEWDDTDCTLIHVRVLPEESAS